MKWYAIDEEQLAKLKRIYARLHTEMRLNGNEMRDLGHAIELIVRNCEQIQIPETDKELLRKAVAGMMKKRD